MPSVPESQAQSSVCASWRRLVREISEVSGTAGQKKNKKKNRRQTFEATPNSGALFHCGQSFFSARLDFRPGTKTRQRHKNHCFLPVGCCESSCRCEISLQAQFKSIHFPYNKAESQKNEKKDTRKWCNMQRHKQSQQPWRLFYSN